MATDVSSPLPLLTLAPGMTVTVEAGDSAATVTKLNVKVFQVQPVEQRAASPILLRGR